MQTHPFCSDENSDIIQQHSRVALRADESKIGYVFAVNDDGACLIHFDHAPDMEYIAPADLIPLAPVINDPALYTSTLI